MFSSISNGMYLMAVMTTSDHISTVSRFFTVNDASGRTTFLMSYLHPCGPTAFYPPLLHFPLFSPGEYRCPQAVRVLARTRFASRQIQWARYPGLDSLIRFSAMVKHSYITISYTSKVGRTLVRISELFSCEARKSMPTTLCF